MDVSIGVMAYNEEKNIGRLLEALLNQRTDRICIKEIIVVSSGSTDRTDEIVRKACKKNRKIVLIIQKKREGKPSAINLFIKKSKSPILVLESADTIPENDSIELLCKPFCRKEVGIVGGRPIPRDSGKTLIGFAVRLLWKLHHKISLKNPKFGELIAFRKVFQGIEKTLVDEEYIAMTMQKKGYRGLYSPKSVVYNSGAKTMHDFVNQRRRIYSGHLELEKRWNYKVSTINNLRLLLVVFKEIKSSNFFQICFAIFLEGYSRTLGIFDYYTKRSNYVWDISKTTKE